MSKAKMSIEKAEMVTYIKISKTKWSKMVTYIKISKTKWSKMVTYIKISKTNGLRLKSPQHRLTLTG